MAQVWSENFNPNTYVGMITTNTTEVKWFEISVLRSTCTFSAKLVFYVGIKEQNHEQNPLNVTELHLGPSYVYILV